MNIVDNAHNTSAVALGRILSGNADGGRGLELLVLFDVFLSIFLRWRVDLFRHFFFLFYLFFFLIFFWCRRSEGTLFCEFISFVQFVLMFSCFFWGGGFV